MPDLIHFAIPAFIALLVAEAAYHEWDDRWRYILKPPGWTLDGRTKTSDQLRKERG